MPDFPNNIPFSVSEPISNHQGYISESQSLKTFAISNGAQRWEFDLTTSLLPDPELRQVWAFLNSKGKHKTFDVELPLYSKPNGTVTGSVSASASYASGVADVVFNNYTPAIGDFVRFASHNKVYQVEDANGSTATLFPPLLSNVNSGESVQVDNVKFTVRVPSKPKKFKLDAKKLVKLKFSCIEVF